MRSFDVGTPRAAEELCRRSPLAISGEQQFRRRVAQVVVRRHRGAVRPGSRNQNYVAFRRALRQEAIVTQDVAGFAYRTDDVAAQTATFVESREIDDVVMCAVERRADQ